jgi:flavin-dependent dehydrogenase
LGLKDMTRVGNRAGTSGLRLGPGSRVAVVGGGPAGSLFCYFLLTMSERTDLPLSVDVFEPKDFSSPGPSGCNMCGGIVSESLVQLLATEGILLPSSVVQRGIDSYVLHMDVGTVRIEPPGREKRIAAVHRGAGPRGNPDMRWGSFDAFLLNLAAEKGASVIRERVAGIDWSNGKPRLHTNAGERGEYDLVAGTVGVNSPALKLFREFLPRYSPPATTKTHICDFLLGKDNVDLFLGSSMHVFLLPLPRLEFAAIIPKGEYATVCLLGRDIDVGLVDAFLASSVVKRCFPPNWKPSKDHCRCWPAINVGAANRPFGDRMVFIGDSGVNRLYKDGIGGAYRAAKAAAKTAIFHGVAEEDFRRHYRPTCNALSRDNAIGKVIFTVTTLIRNVPVLRRGVLRMTAAEQADVRGAQRMSAVLWDTFTGSASYRNVFVRTLHPLFMGRLFGNTLGGAVRLGSGARNGKEDPMQGDLGKTYSRGELIIRQGDAGECMYVIQSGTVEVLREEDGSETHLAYLGEGDFFGEMALFEKEVRSATVRAASDVRVLTIDRKIVLRKIHEDPSLAFRVMQRMSHRIRELNILLARSGSEKEPT